jgi:D-mannonate dehydratase
VKAGFCNNPKLLRNRCSDVVDISQQVNSRIMFSHIRNAVIAIKEAK